MDRITPLRQGQQSQPSPGVLRKVKASQEEADGKEEKVYRRWLHWKISPVGGVCEDMLDTALADGAVLSKMLKVFCDLDFIAKKSPSPLQRLDQTTTILQLFKQQGWPAAIDSKSICEQGPGHRRHILGWIWQIINKDQLMNYAPVYAKTDGVHDIYHWVDQYLADKYPNIDRGEALKGLSAFQDGRLLTALVHRTDASAIDLNSLPPGAPAKTDLAINTAAEKIGVPPLVDAEDIIDAADDKSLVTYLCAFRDTVTKRDRGIYKWVEDYLDNGYSDIPQGYPQEGLPSYQDGRLLEYLVHKTDPTAIDLDKQRSLEPHDRIREGIGAAKRLLPINPRLRPQDLLDRPDERKLKQYLTEFRDALGAKEEADRKAAEEADRARREAEERARREAEEEERRRQEAEAARRQRELDAEAARRQKELEEEERRKKEEERRRKEAEERARLAAEEEERKREAERRRKEAEEEARRRKEAADARARAEAEAAERERRRKEAEEKARREAEEEEERRRKEDDARRRREEEEEERRRREAVTGIRDICAVRALIPALQELVWIEEFDSRADARMCRMYGPGLEGATVGEPTFFTIEARNAKGERIATGGEPFQLRIDGPVSPNPQIIEDKGDGTYLAKYTPLQEGPHTIRVTLRGENVAQSPVLITVKPNAKVDPRSCRMYGPGLERGTVDEPTFFTIEARNAQGQLVKGVSVPFKLRIVGPAGQDPKLQRIEDNFDGTYTAKYTPVAPGEHSVRVTLEGENVAQSPVRVDIDAKRDLVVPDENLDDLWALLEAIKREIARDKKNLDELPEVRRTVEKLGLKDERAREVGRELKDEDEPRLKELLRALNQLKNRAAATLGDPNMPKSEIRKLVTPMLHNAIGDLEDWGQDYKAVMDKVNNLRPKSDAYKRQRVHVWVHRKGEPIPQHIMVTSNKPTEQLYRRHIRIDASKGFYDTHNTPAAYLEGILGITGELALQKIDSRDRYLTGNKDEDSLDEVSEVKDEKEPYFCNDKGQRVRPSLQPLLLEGALQNDRGRMLYCFLYADCFVTTDMVNNGERYEVRSLVKFDDQSRLQVAYGGSDRAFSIRGNGGRERVFNAKSRHVASTWTSNIDAVMRSAK